MKSRIYSFVILSFVWYFAAAPLFSHTLPYAKPKTIIKDIKWSDGIYQLDEKIPISKNSVDLLLALCRMNPVKEWLYPKHNKRWLLENADKALAEFLSSYNLIAWSGQNELFRHKFQNYHKGTYTHLNYVPTEKDIKKTKNVFLRIFTSNNKKVFISSGNAYPVLVPWTVINDGKVVETYDPLLTNTIMKYFPKSCFRKIDKCREYRSMIASRIVKEEFTNEWNTLEVKARFNSYIERLSETFTVLRPKIRRKPRYGSNFPTDYLEAELYHRRLPRNLCILLSIRAENIDEVFNKFVGSVASTVKTIRATKPILRFLRTYDDSRLLLSYTDSGYLHDETGAKFFDDYSKRFDTFDVFELWQKLSKGWLLTFQRNNESFRSYSQWFLLRDGRSYLWSASGNSRVLKSPSKFYGQRLVLDYYPLDRLAPKSSWFGYEK